ncbi:hypothetical protein PAXINDRAFT_8604 [Paxillus involutus ATCC 200175]|nr:hypothetical protein PAXINDRAFT_8604 [Paxillus involutus ATCC 200175]
MLRFLRRVLPRLGDASRLDEDVPDVDIEASQQHTEEPKPSSQTPLKVLESYGSAITGLTFFPDGRRLVSGSEDRSLVIWDVTIGDAETRLTGHTGRVRSVAMAPDGSMFASGSEDGTLRFWDGSTGDEVGEPIHTHSADDQGVWGLAFSPDSRRVATTGNHTVQMWDVLTRTPVTEPLHIPGGGDYTVAFSRDGSRIAADTGGGSVGVWNLVSFTPDGRQLVTASFDRKICQWDIQSGALALIGIPLTGHSDSIYDGVISRDGNTLATASHDRTVRFWNLKTGNQKSCFLRHKSEVWRVALSRDGSLLATGDFDGKVYLWDMKAIEAEFSEEVHDEMETGNNATATSNRPATSRANAREVERLRLTAERLRMEARDKEVAAARVHELLMLGRQERLRIEVERLRIEAQEKQAAHELLVLDRQIELARIHAGYPASGSIAPPQG